MGPPSEVDLLEQMATFVQLVDGKSLSSAARARGVSLPAVSRQLRALEEELGATLVVRSTRRLHVTDAGQRWYEHASRILREVEAARDDVRGTHVARGRLVVSAPLTFGSAFVVPRLKTLAEDNPHLAIDLRLEDRLADIVGEGVDVAVRAGSPPPDSTSFIAHPIASNDRVVVASPRWSKRYGTPRDPRDLEARECLIQVTTDGSPVRWSLRRGDEDVVVAVKGRIRTNAPLCLKDLAVDGAGPAYLPDWLVEDELGKGTLRRLLPKWVSAPVTIWAVHRAELRGAPRLRVFLDALRPRAQYTS